MKMTVKEFMEAGKKAGADAFQLCAEPFSIFVEGPDRVGKSTIGKMISELSQLPLFKCQQEKQIFRSGQNGALMFDLGLVDFISQTKYHFVSDRSYVSEWVYAHAFDRESDWSALELIDEGHFRLGTKILYLYSSSTPGEVDDLVPPEKYWLVKSWYDRFCDWTACEVVKYDVSKTAGLGTLEEKTGVDAYACLELLKIWPASERL